ncbi:MAG: hypothetical protein WCI00_09240 [bacterium]
MVGILILGQFLSQSASSQNTVKGIQSLYQSVLPIWKSAEQNINTIRGMRGIVTATTTKLYTSSDCLDWVMIYKKGDDTLFRFKSKINSLYNNPYDPITISNNSTDRDFKRIITAVTDVLVNLVGYDSTISIIKPFFDTMSSALYFAELEKAQKKVIKMMFYGHNTIKSDAGVCSFGRKEDGGGYYYDFSGPGNWSLQTRSVEVKVGSTNIFGPFCRFMEMETNAFLIQKTNDYVFYRCGLYGCEKNTHPDCMGEWESVSFEEFKSNYRSPF